MAVVSNGTTLIDNGALDPAVPTGSLILLSTQTASASANISFTSGIDSTYDSYVFKFYDIHPATDNVQFEFNMSTDSGSNYNVTKTSSFFYSGHNESGTNTYLEYNVTQDLAQSTAFQPIAHEVGNDADQSCSGSLQLFNPASTTYVKHFIANTNIGQINNYTYNAYSAGYGNTTSAINAVRFQMSSGNIDDGIIKMYGVK